MARRRPRAGGAVHRRRPLGARALPCRLRLHLRLAAVPRRRRRAGPARADADARTRRSPVLPRTCGGRSGGAAGERLCLPGRGQRRRRCLHVRHRDAARRRLRQRHPLYRRRRQHADAAHARLLHPGLGDRHRAPAVLVRAAEPAADLAPDQPRALAGAALEPRPVRRDRRRHMADRASARRRARVLAARGLAARTLAAACRCRSACGVELRHAPARRPPLGRDLGLRPLGSEAVPGARHRRRELAPGGRPRRRPRRWLGRYGPTLPR